MVNRRAAYGSKAAAHIRKVWETAGGSEESKGNRGSYDFLVQNLRHLNGIVQPLGMGLCSEG